MEGNRLDCADERRKPCKTANGCFFSVSSRDRMDPQMDGPPPSWKDRSLAFRFGIRLSATMTVKRERRPVNDSVVTPHPYCVVVDHCNRTVIDLVISGVFLPSFYCSSCD